MNHTKHFQITWHADTDSEPFQTCKVEGFAKVVTQPAITSSKLTVKTLEQGVIPE